MKKIITLILIAFAVGLNAQSLKINDAIGGLEFDFVTSGNKYYYSNSSSLYAFFDKDSKVKIYNKTGSAVANGILFSLISVNDSIYLTKEDLLFALQELDAFNPSLFVDTSGGVMQTLLVNGYNISISGGNTVSLPTQTLSISGDSLIISGGNAVGLPSASSEWVDVTKLQLDSLISGKYLKGNYLVSGVDTSLYGGTSIYVSSLNDSVIGSSGYGVFYNPKYDQSIAGYGIWDTSNVYSIGDTCIWGGKHWINQNGNVGASTNIFTLNVEWVVIPFDAVSYNVAIDEIKYDYLNDMIVYRNEANSNVVSVDKSTNERFLDIIGYLPIRVFQWGNLFNYNNEKGVGNQSIKKSYNENINFRGSYQSNLTFDNGSSQYNLSFDNGYQSNLTFDNGSSQSNLSFDNSNQNNLTFDNGSSQYNLTFDNSSQSYLTFNNSSQNNLTFDNGSSQNNLTFDNDSYQNNLTFDNGSSQNNLTFDNGSYQSYLTSILGFKQERIKLDNYVLNRAGVPVTADEENKYYTNYITQP